MHACRNHTFFLIGISGGMVAARPVRRRTAGQRQQSQSRQLRDGFRALPQARQTHAQGKQFLLVDPQAREWNERDMRH